MAPCKPYYPCWFHCTIVYLLCHKIQIWCRFLESILFLLPGHKSVYKSWKPLPNYFPNLVNQFIVLLEVYNPTSSTITSPRCHIIIMFTFIIQWVLNGDILSFLFEFLVFWQGRIFRMFYTVYISFSWVNFLTFFSHLPTEVIVVLNQS